VPSAQFPHWSGYFERLQLDLWLVRNKLDVAASWAGSKLEDPSLESQTGNRATQLAVIRALVNQRDQESLERALTLLEELLSLAEEEGRMGVQIESLALQAILYWKRGEEARAMMSLEHALRLARPEGYIHLFTDLGLPMGRLLQEAHARKVMLAYVDALLAVYGDVSSSVTVQSNLVEPLTSREEDILNWLSAGLTNQEIADELIISAETVKKHTSHIYQKLGVHNRTEAAAKARELNLLQ